MTIHNEVKEIVYQGKMGAQQQITQHIHHGLTPLPFRTLLPSVATSYMLGMLYAKSVRKSARHPWLAKIKYKNCMYYIT